LINRLLQAPTKNGGITIGHGRAAYRKSNLQEYWRWSLGQYEDHIENTLVKDQYLINAGLLIKVDGKLWHAIHLKDTNIKANNALEIAILKRLDTASEISEQFPFSAQFTDARCQFTGARAQGITKLWRDYSFANSEPQSDKPQLHISAEWSELSNVNCSFLIFGDHLDLSNAILKNDINFEHAEFVGITKFTDTIFFSRSTFLKASFKRLSEFAYTIFLKSAIFSYATFSAYADFANTNFLHDTYFGNVTFNDSVLFQGVAFLSSVKFEHAIFSGNTYFYAAVFTKTISFVEAKFHKPTYFSDTFWA